MDMFIFISKITLLCLAAALLPKRAPPTAMINFCLRERGISLSYTCIHSTKRISGGASPNGGKACEGGEKGEKEGRAGDSAQSLQKHSKCRVGMPTECLAPGTRNTTLFRELVKCIRLTIHNQPQTWAPFFFISNISSRPSLHSLITLCKRDPLRGALLWWTNCPKVPGATMLTEVCLRLWNGVRPSNHQTFSFGI